MKQITYEGNIFTLNTFGTPDHFIGTEHDIPDNFYWQNGSKKGENQWIMKQSAIELGLINN